MGRIAVAVGALPDALMTVAGRLDAVTEEIRASAQVYPPPRRRLPWSYRRSRP